MEKIIHYCWFGGKEIPADVKKYIKSWQKKLPDYKIMEWNEKNFDVNSTKFSKKAFEEKKWAFVSDVARIYALYEYGGLYLDTDVKALKNIEFAEDNDFFMGKESEEYVGTAIIGVKEKHNKHIKKILDIYKNTEFDSSDIYKVTGPKLFTDYFKEMGLEEGDGNQELDKGHIMIYDRAYFYPKSYDGHHDKYNENTCMVHDFKASWTSDAEKLCNFLIKHHMRFMIKPIFGLNDFIKHTNKKEWIKNIIKNNYIYIISFILLIALLGIAYAAFYPAIMTSDSQDQFQQILTGSFSNTHPAFYTWLMSLVIFKSPQMIPIIQILVFAFIWVYALKTVLKKLTNPLWKNIIAIITTIMIGLFPLNQLFAVTFWKDILYTYVLLLANVWVYKVFIDNELLTIKKWIVVAIILILVSTFRHNGIIVGALLFLVIAIENYRNFKINKKHELKKTCIVGLFMLIIYGFITMIFVPYVLKAESSNPIFSKAPLIHINGKLLSSNAITNEEDLKILNEIIPVEDWKNLYNNYTHNTLMFSGKINTSALEENKYKLLWITIKNTLKNPLIVSKHYLELTSIVWSIEQRDGAHTNAIVNQIYPSEISEKLNLETRPLNNTLNEKYNEILKNIEKNKFLKTIFTRPALYMYLSILLVIIISGYTKRKAYISLLTPMLFNIMSILPILTDQDTRYFYITFLSFFFILLTFIADMIKNKDKVIEVHKEMIKKNKYWLAALILLMLFIDYFSYLTLLSKIPTLRELYRILFIVFMLLVNISCLYLIKWLNKNKELPKEKKFLKIGLIIGIFYCLFIPIMGGTDEFMHFYRAYQVSKGDIINNSDKETEIKEQLLVLPYWTLKEKYSKSYIFEKYEEGYNKSLPSTIVAKEYSPVEYIPQVFAFLLANVFHFNGFFTFFLVRIINFLAWLIICYHAIKLLPSKKSIVTLLLLAPAMVSLASSSSGDIFSTAIGFLFISYIMNKIVNKTKLTISNKILLIIMGLIISQFKSVYVLLTLLVFLIPKECFKNKKDKNIYCIMLVFLSILLDLIWTKIGRGSTIADSSFQLQMEYVLNDPISAIIIVFRTYYQDFSNYLFNFVAGNEMCFSKANISSIWPILYLIIMAISYFENDNQINLSFIGKLLIWLISILIVGLVSMALYLGWTASRVGIGNMTIVGVQSRYFILLIPILLFTLPKSKIKIENQNIIYILCVVINSFVLIETVLSTFEYWYYI